MAKKAAALLIAALALLALSPETSPTHALGRLPFQILLSEDGGGRIFMNNGSTPAWSACKPDLTACAPFATGNFSTGAAAPGTVFWAGGELITPLWMGNVHVTELPSVQGRLQGNHVVRPVAGSWAGGWSNDYDELTLSICKTASGKHCLEINDEGLRDECAMKGATLIDPAFAGRYLRVVDRRYGSGTLFIGVGHPAYYPAEEIEPRATLSMAVVGKIAPATGPPSVKCGPPPLIDASISGDGSALVVCRLIACRVTLTAKRGGHTARLQRRIPAHPLLGILKPVAVRLAQPSLERLGGGPVLVTVEVNGRPIASRTLPRGQLALVAEYPPGS